VRLSDVTQSLGRFKVRLTITPDGEIQVLRIESDLGCHSPAS
jgi:hypothetical protein